jgi:hypothetical protein
MALGITTDAGVQRILDLIETDFTYIGIGTGTYPGEGGSVLDNEDYRKAVSITRVDETSILEAYWDDTEANGNTYTETGVFGDGATASLDSGTLITGNTINIDKDSTQSLTVSIEITVAAVNV